MNESDLHDDIKSSHPDCLPHLGVLAEPPDEAGEPGAEGGHHDVVNHHRVGAQHSLGCSAPVSLWRGGGGGW